MNAFDFFTKNAWPIVFIMGFIVLIIYRGPLGNFISNLKKGKVSQKKGEGFSVDLEVDRQFQKELESKSNKPELVKKQIPEIAVEKQAAAEKATKDQDVSWITLFFDKKFEEAREALLKDINQMEDVDSTLAFLTVLASLSMRFRNELGMGRSFSTTLPISELQIMYRSSWNLGED